MSDLLRRLLDRDSSLWPEGNASPTRLGWLDVAARMQGEIDDLVAWAAGVEQRRVVLLGMGGSSLGPEVLRAAVGSDRLLVLDTTDPTTVAGVDWGDAFFLVSSKSGTTLEVRALLSYFWDKVPDGRRYAAITDAGTPLEQLAEDSAFRRIFRNPPDIGGRYSVLSWFGLVPAALAGVDVAGLLERATTVDLEEAAALGTAMGEAALAGRDKLTIVVPEPFAAFGLWVEQLVAESTGKSGAGCVPVPTTEPEQGPDRHVVALDLHDPLDLGAEFVRWQVATAVAGAVLEIDPFDEPDVASSKRNTAAVLDELPLPPLATAAPGALRTWLRDEVAPGDYVSLQAYLPYGSETALEQLRRTVRDGLDGCAVTAGYGPRFLHSTGQLHKGGPNRVVVVQIVPRTPAPSVPVPAFPYDFNTLIAAQALGDERSLRAAGRRFLRVGADDPSEVR